MSPRQSLGHQTAVKQIIEMQLAGSRVPQFTSLFPCSLNSHEVCRFKRFPLLWNIPCCAAFPVLSRFHCVRKCPSAALKARMDSPAVDVLLIPVDSGVGLGKILSFRKPSCQARTTMKAKVAQASSEIEQSLCNFKSLDILKQQFWFYVVKSSLWTASSRNSALKQIGSLVVVWIVHFRKQRAPKQVPVSMLLSSEALAEISFVNFLLE